MNEFFTWASLGTYAGAVLATTIITQLLKGISVFDKLPTRIFSYIVAALVLLAATIFGGEINISAIALCFVNAAVVSLAANGAFDALAIPDEDLE